MPRLVMASIAMRECRAKSAFYNHTLLLNIDSKIENEERKSFGIRTGIINGGGLIVG